jgi:16S rRNA processing protein RimM
MTGPDTTIDLPWPDDAVEVGRIVDAWGIKGWVKVQAFASDPQALFSTRRWFSRAPQDALPGRPGAASSRAGERCLRVTTAKEHGDVVVAQLQGVETRNDAEALRGTRIFVSRASFPTPSDDEFYWVDLIGLDVVNRQGEALGTVVGLIDTGPHSVIRVAPVGSPNPPDASSSEAAENERLIPFVGAYVDDVSLPQRRITVDWGLDY